LAVVLYRDLHPPEISAVRPRAQVEDLEAKVQELYK
jgi:hypothetical protein